MTVDELVSTVRSAINRGNSVDALIPTYLKSSLQTLEMDDWKFTGKRVGVSVAAGVQTVILPADPFANLLKIEEAWLANGDYGEKALLVQVSHDQISGGTDGTFGPVGYVLTVETGSDGVNTWSIFFDAPLSQPLYFYVLAHFTTPWPSSGSATPGFIGANFPMLLVAHTMITLGPVLRAPELQQMWQPIWDANLKQARARDQNAYEANRSR